VRKLTGDASFGEIVGVRAIASSSSGESSMLNPVAIERGNFILEIKNIALGLWLFAPHIRAKHPIGPPALARCTLYQARPDRFPQDDVRVKEGVTGMMIG